MESDTHILYFTKLSGKSQDFYFLVWIHLKMVKRGQSETAFYLGASTNGHMISVNVMSILKYFLQNLKNSLVAKRTIGGETLGRPVDSRAAFGDRATIFRQH